MTEILDNASKAYYEGVPFLTDQEFDSLAEKEGYTPVGYNPDIKVKHLFPLYSLQKVFVGESEPPKYINKVVETPKLDGAAIAIQYKKGKLYKVITRGNGTEGVDITDKFKYTNLVPQKLSFRVDTEGEYQVTGELVAPKEITNARNYAAGALNLKDLQEFRKRDLTFIAYNIKPSIHVYYSSEMKMLYGTGFNSITHGTWEQFPSDGKVFRTNSNEEFDQLGFTSHHPRGAYALKTREEGVETILRRVEWQVGKSGKVTPVGHFDTVEIEDAKISKATLNNLAYIKGLNLEIGCAIKVIRAGSVIPCIVGRVS
jgi:DNA ligase (NAD+)